MDIRFLQSFVIVVDCGSLAEASRRLDLTPAAVATRIKALEDGLGTPLVRRAGRTVKATEAGLKILEHARRVLRDVRDLHAIAHDDVGKQLAVFADGDIVRASCQGPGEKRYSSGNRAVSHCAVRAPKGRA